MASGPVLINHAYPVEYVPRTGRNPRKAWVAGSVPVAIAAIPDAPVAIEMDRVETPYPYLNERPGTVRESYLLVGGGPSLRLDGPGGRPLGPEALAGVDPADPGGPWASRAYPYQHGKPEGAVAESLEALAPRQVRSDGRLAAESRVSDLARRTAMVGGALHVPGPEPVWGVRQPHGYGIVQVAACLETDWDDGTTYAMFRADRLERAVAVAQSLVDEGAALKPGLDHRVQVVGSIAVHRPEALAFDEVRVNGLRLVKGFARHPGASGFAALPIPVLREWLSFREAVDRLAAGEPDGLMAAVSALSRCKRALPEAPDPQSRAGHHEACALLHRQLAGVPAMVAHWEADAGALVPDEDVAAIAGAHG